VWARGLKHINAIDKSNDTRVSLKISKKEEIKACSFEIERGETFTLRELRHCHCRAGEEWFANLRLDQESLKDPRARSRPRVI